MKVDPRIVDTVVAHAQGKSADATDTAKAEAVGKGDEEGVVKDKDEAIAAVDQSEFEPSGTEGAGE